MGVHVDAAGDDELAGAVDDLLPIGGGECADGGDAAVGADADVGHAVTVHVDDPAVAEQHAR